MFRAEIKPSVHPGKTCFILGGETFEVDSEYTIAKGLGYGSHGILCLAEHGASDDRLAIEKVADAFADIEEAKELVTELVLLQQLRHANIISMLRVMKPTSADFTDVYVVYEVMAQDLREKIKSNRLSIKHAQLFTYQMLCALNYIHTAGLAHADFRPKHLLVDNECNLKVTNFTTSFSGQGDCQAILQRIDQPLWYCAPELLACSPVDLTMDLWSAGCILAELLLLKPLFRGKTPGSVLNRICNPVEPANPRETVSSPLSEGIQQLTSMLQANTQPSYAAIVQSRRADCPAPALDLLDKLLQLSPAKRISAAAALQHPWFANVREPELEAPAAGQISLPSAAAISTPEALRALVQQLASREP